MPKKVIIIFFLVVLFQAAFGQTISEIQQTNEPGDDGTYPSTYIGQEVTISPVTIGAKGFNGSDNNMFAFDLNPGIWNGIYINNAQNTGNLRAMVSITGTVQENNGMTELVNATITQINAGPFDITANVVTLTQMQDLAIAERYESSLIEIKNLKYTGLNEDDYWLALDAEDNEIRVSNGFFDSNPEVNDFWDSIKGIVTFESGNFVINPRNEADFITPHPSNIEITPQLEKIGNKLYVHFNSDRQILESYPVINYGLDYLGIDLDFDKTFLSFVDYRVDDIDLTPSYTINPDVNDGNVVLNYVSEDTFRSEDSGTTLTLIFDIKEFGNMTLKVNNLSFANIQSEAVFQKLSNRTLTFNNTYDDKEAYLSIYNDNNAKNIFNPYQNERLTIKYGFKQGYSTKTIIRIYDLKGRLVYTPVNDVHSGLGEFRWDGRDKNRELVDIGTYICQVEVVIRETGKKYTTDQPIVVAGQLK